MVVKNRPWTEDEMRELSAAVEKGVSLSRAATIFKRTVEAVRGKAREIGKPFPTIKAVRRARNAKIEAAERDQT